MPPELLEADVLSKATDVYSLGEMGREGRRWPPCWQPGLGAPALALLWPHHSSALRPLLPCPQLWRPGLRDVLQPPPLCGLPPAAGVRGGRWTSSRRRRALAPASNAPALRAPQIIHSKVVLKEGLQLPPECPGDFSQLVCECLDGDSARRPCFDRIVERLGAMLAALPD